MITDFVTLFSNGPSSCIPEQFHCKVSGKCIPEDWRCDGDMDCAKGEGNSNLSIHNENRETWFIFATFSDEEQCKKEECEESEFTCTSNGACIPLKWQCDSEEDCLDASDEQNCVDQNIQCDTGEFQCRSGGCISMGWKCDGDPDCKDGSDEAMCK